MRSLCLQAPAAVPPSSCFVKLLLRAPTGVKNKPCDCTLTAICLTGTLSDVLPGIQVLRGTYAELMSCLLSLSAWPQAQPKPWPWHQSSCPPPVTVHDSHRPAGNGVQMLTGIGMSMQVMHWHAIHTHLAAIGAVVVPKHLCLACQLSHLYVCK